MRMRGRRIGVTSHVDAERSCAVRHLSYTVLNNTRQGYARKSTLKLAGYLFLEV